RQGVSIDQARRVLLPPLQGAGPHQDRPGGREGPGTNRTEGRIGEIMRGSITRRGESWFLRIYLGKNPETGKPIQKGISVQGTKKDAERELRKYLHDLDNGSYVNPEKVTVAEFLERWLKDYLEPSGRKDWTRKSYTSIIRKHLIPKLGHVQLQRLTPDMVQRY